VDGDLRALPAPDFTSRPSGRDSIVTTIRIAQFRQFSFSAEDEIRNQSPISPKANQRTNLS
jgi:hypothetical protein